METHSNVVVRPLRRGRFGWVDGGVYLSDGSLIKDWPILGSSHTNQLVAKLRCPAIVSPKVVREGIYGGVWFQHFGHFLTETLPNLVMISSASKPGETRAIYFQTLHEDMQELPDLPPYVTPFLQRVGIDPGRLRLVTSPTCFDALTIPAAPFRKKYRYAECLPQLLDDTLHLPCGPRSNRRLYFTRRGIGSVGRNAKAEAELERVFSGHGFEIIAPETLSIDQQIDLIADAKIVAGQNGSALHWALLSRGLEAGDPTGLELEASKGDL